MSLEADGRVQGGGLVMMERYRETVSELIEGNLWLMGRISLEFRFGIPRYSVFLDIFLDMLL